MYPFCDLRVTTLLLTDTSYEAASMSGFAQHRSCHKHYSCQALSQSNKHGLSSIVLNTAGQQRSNNCFTQYVTM